MTTTTTIRLSLTPDGADRAVSLGARVLGRYETHGCGRVVRVELPADLLAEEAPRVKAGAYSRGPRRRYRLPSGAEVSVSLGGPSDLDEIL